MVAATIMACWVVLWVVIKTIGGMWTADCSGSCHGADDAQMVNFKPATGVSNRIDEVQTELETLVQVCTKNRPRGPHAAARYDATLQELEQHAAASVPVLLRP